MIKISKMADYAVVVLSVLARDAAALKTACSVSQTTRLPEPTVAKVLKILAREGLIDSIRGANGGYKLARPAHLINVAEVLTAIEGPVSLTACVDGSHETCDFESHCPVKGRWDDVNMAIRVALESITLADMLTGRFCFKPPIKSKETHERL